MQNSESICVSINADKFWTCPKNNLASVYNTTNTDVCQRIWKVHDVCLKCTPPPSLKFDYLLKKIWNSRDKNTTPVQFHAFYVSFWSVLVKMTVTHFLRCSCFFPFCDWVIISMWWKFSFLKTFVEARTAIRWMTIGLLFFNKNMRECYLEFFVIILRSFSNIF